LSFRRDNKGGKLIKERAAGQDGVNSGGGISGTKGNLNSANKTNEKELKNSGFHPLFSRKKNMGKIVGAKAEQISRTLKLPQQILYAKAGGVRKKGGEKKRLQTKKEREWRKKFGVLSNKRKPSLGVLPKMNGVTGNLGGGKKRQGKCKKKKTLTSYSKRVSPGPC